MSYVRETSAFVESFPACAGVCGIAPKATPGRALAEIASAIRHFKNCKSDSHDTSIRLQKRDQVVE
ncbi:hypothetical protein BDI4_740008 [Burkholderia diffusa]|nr:hypothetical protein BDI4_740008 [Burkholderia diffusa]